MPTYSYRDEQNNLVDVVMSIPEREKAILMEDAEGAWLSEGRKLTRDLGSDLNPFQDTPATARFECDVLGVQPHQIPSAIAKAKAAGIDVEFTPTGAFKPSGPANFKAYAEFCGFYARNSYGGKGEPRRKNSIKEMPDHRIVPIKDREGYERFKRQLDIKYGFSPDSSDSRKPLRVSDQMLQEARAGLTAGRRPGRG